MLDKYKKRELSEEQMEQLEEKWLYQMFRQENESKLRSELKTLADSLKDEADTEGGEIPKTTLTVAHRSNHIVMGWAAAASIAILAVAGWWLFLKPTPSTPTDAFSLVDTYLKKENAPVWSTTMSGEPSVAEKEASAKEAYQKGEFARAISLFNTIPPNTKEHYFYMGISALKQPEPNASLAIESLLKARKLANGWQEDAINWHLALAYIRANKKEEARKELQNIIQIGRDNTAKAETLLKAFNK